MAVALFAAAAVLFWPRNYTGQPQPGFPLSPNEFLIHGARFYELERMAEAVALFEDGRRLFPRHPDFPASLAAVDLAEGRNDSALERIEQALQYRVYSRVLLEQHVIALDRLGRKPDARKAAATLQQYFPGSPLAKDLGSKP